MMSGLGSRQFWIYVHLGLAAFFFPLLLVMPISGISYLLDYKGTLEKTEAFRLTELPSAKGAEQEAYFRQEFLKNGIEYDFEYIKEGGNNLVFRPTTRVYFEANRADTGEWVVLKVDPSFMSRLIELHKGHGPKVMRWFEKAFGMALILTALSGLWLAVSVRPYRKVTIASFGLGALILALCMI